MFPTFEARLVAESLNLDIEILVVSPKKNLYQLYLYFSANTVKIIFRHGEKISKNDARVQIIMLKKW